MRVLEVKSGEDKTIRARGEYDIYSRHGKGVILLLAFVCDGANISLHVIIDDKWRIDFPTIDFFFNLNITHPNDIIYCHLYDKTVLPEQYGLLLLRKVEFEKNIRIYLFNEDDVDRTIQKFLLIAEIEI